MFGVAMEYTVNFSYDDEASVWIATSEDIIGLVLESDSIDELVERVKNAAPELLSLNGQLPAKTINCNIQRQLTYV